MIPGYAITLIYALCKMEKDIYVTVYHKDRGLISTRNEGFSGADSKGINLYN